MRKSLLFAAFAMLAVSGFADELLDEVLRWDRPVTWKASGGVQVESRPASGMPTMQPEEPMQEGPGRGKRGTIQSRESKSWEGEAEASTIQEEEVVAARGKTEDEDFSLKKAFEQQKKTEVESSIRLKAFGGGGDLNEARVGQGELTIPLKVMPVDLALCGFGMTQGTGIVGMCPIREGKP